MDVGSFFPTQRPVPNFGLFLTLHDTWLTTRRRRGFMFFRVFFFFAMVSGFILSSGPSFVLLSVSVDPLVFVASCPCV